MKKEHIHVIMRHTGDYEDARSETVCAVKDKKAADALAKRMTDQAERVCEKLSKLQDKYFAEPDTTVDSAAEKAWIKCKEGKGTRLDKEWSREVDMPTYAVDRLVVRT